MQKDVDILFIIPPYHKRNGSGSIFPLGIGAIMACLEQNNLSYDYINCTTIIDTLVPSELQRLDKELRNSLRHYNPILVGIGPCVSPGIKGIEIVARCCLDMFGSERVFAGGPLTMLPSQEWLFYKWLGLSYLIKGDGEEAVCEALEAVKSGQSLKKCGVVSFPEHSKINIIHDLDKLPFPKRPEIENYCFSERRRSFQDKAKTAHIVSSRGCPYHCSYCVSGNLKIPFRKRSAESIVEEMNMLSTQYNVTDIVFYDDCFFTGVKTIHDEIDEFCTALERTELHLTWQFEIRPDILIEIKDDELLRICSLGCRQMNIGIEKTHENGASLFGKPYNYETHVCSMTSAARSSSLAIGCWLLAVSSSMNSSRIRSASTTEQIQSNVGIADC